MRYLRKYLKVAPASHAIWRAIEAEEISKIQLQRPILDLGCGYGEFAGVFYESSVEMGIDLSGRDLQIAAQSRRYSQLVLADARKMPFSDNIFKTVLSVSVVEHIKNTKKVLSEVYRVLVPGGQFVFTTPALGFTKFMFYPRIFRSLKLESLALYYERVINKIFKHHCLYTELQWRKMLKDTGFEIDKLETIIPANVVQLWDLLLIFALPSQLAKVFWGKRIVIQNQFRINLAYKLLMRAINNPNGQASNFLIVARRPEGL